MARTERQDARRRLISPRRARLVIGKPGYWPGFVVVTGAYVATAKFGIDLSVSHGVITPVWAPSGISLAALVLLGRRYWPAVALGAFIANATSGAEPALAAAIAVGNTLEAVAGAFLLGRVGFRVNLERVRDVLMLAAFGAGISTLIAATNGVALLFLTHTAHGSFGSNWLLWWFGDAVGILMVAPLLLVAFSAGKKWPSKAPLLEALAVIALLTALSAVVFLAGAWRYPYLIFPLLLWAALRFRQFGAAASSFLVGAIATWGTVAGTVPFGGSNPTERVQIIQALVGVLAISLLVVGATLAERETANKKLRQTAARLSEAQAMTHIGSWEWEIVTNAVTWSDELYRIWGLDPDRFGASYEAYLETVHHDDREHVEGTLRRALETGGCGYECRIVRPDGAERFIRAHGKVVADESGRPVKLIGTAQDVTEEKQIEAERERLLARERAQNERLRELDRIKDTFLASVSHEFRTPLTSILGYIGLLRDETTGKLPDEQRRYLEIAWRNTERLQRLVGDLLLAAQTDAGRLMLEPGRVDLRELASECVASARLRAEAAGVEVVLAGGEVPTLEGDPARLAQLVENLLSNAIKFSSDGGCVELRTYAENEHVVLEVSDSGIGIPAAQQRHVFQRFFRSSNAVEQAIQGTGLGLSIAKMIAEAHGGVITYESEEAEGTTFRVELPLAADGAERHGEHAEVS
jgi:PAS domain S-box-containing protein